MGAQTKGWPVLAAALALAAGGCAGVVQNPDDYDVLVRPDRVKVVCQRLPPDLVNRATKVHVEASVRKIGQVVQAGLVHEIDPQRVFETSLSVADYRVLAREVCLQYANGLLTPAEYKAVQERLLPAAKAKAETEARVDAEFERVDIFALDAEKKRLSLHLRVRPVTRDAREAAHVIYGLAVVHDERRLKAGHKAERTTRACAEVATCLGFRLWDQAENPIIVRASDAKGAQLSFTVDVPRATKAVRLFWEMYQREAEGGHRCVADAARPGPAGGIPFLKVVDRAGRTQSALECYKTYGDQVVVLDD